MPYPKKPEPRWENIRTVFGTVAEQREKDRLRTQLERIGRGGIVSTDSRLKPKTSKFWSKLGAFIIFLILAWGFATNWGSDPLPTQGTTVSHDDRP